MMTKLVESAWCLLTLKKPIMIIYWYFAEVKNCFVIDLLNKL